jgi:serine/threonine protein kinase
LDNKIFTSTFLISKRLGLNPSEKIDNLFLDSQCQYYAPELLKTGTLSKAADVYSLGMIIKSMSFDK